MGGSAMDIAAAGIGMDACAVAKIMGAGAEASDTSAARGPPTVLGADVPFCCSVRLIL